MSKKVKAKERRRKIITTTGLVIYFYILICAGLLRSDDNVINRDFWHDEAFSYEYAQMPVSYILDSTDVHPLLFTFFAKLLIDGLGIHDIILLRTIILCLSLILMWSVFYTISNIFRNENVGLVTIAIMAISPTFIHYNTEFRSYTLAMIFVVWQVYLYHKIFLKNEDNTKMANLFFVFLSVLMIATHYLTGLILLTQILYSTIKRKYQHYIEFVFIGVLSLPTIIYLIKTLPKIQSFWFKDIDFISLISTFNYIFAPPMKLTGVWTLFILFGLVVGIFSKHEFGKRGRLMLLYTIIPIITMWLISQFIPFYHHRYFLFGGIFLFVAIAHGFNIVEKRYPQYHYVAYALCIFFLLVGLPHYHSTLNYELRDASEALKLDVRDNTFAVIHETPFSQTPMKVYLPEGRHILVSNLTEEMLFTSGGAVIDNHYYNETEALKYTTPYNNLYKVSDKFYPEHAKQIKNIIYSEGGLWVYRIR